MKWVCQLFFLIVFAANVTAQKTRLILPEFKNLNTKDEYPVKSLMATYTGTFDILISLKGCSNWIALDQKTTVLAYKENGWYKINISSGYIFSDTIIDKISIIKINNTVGETLWSIIIANHLFDMEDERTKKSDCASRIIDGPGYEFEILTADKYKKIYAYFPQFFEERCPGVVERKQILNCLIAFEKYLGT